ncbi:MAG: dTDP-4-dehydrorhamnose reductase [Oscillospiraceae bacterium]
MNIIITGSKGQLGNQLCSIIKNGSSQLGEIPSEYKNCTVTAVDVDELDITDSAAVNEFIGRVKPDIVINCAAMTNVNGCEEMLETAMKVNAIGPRNLAAACEKAGAKLVHVSTDYVFGGTGNVPYTEWDVCAPQSVYGKSKLLGESYVKEQCKKYFIVRTAWLYGDVGGNFVRTMIKLGTAKDEITVVNDQRGNPTYAEDLAHHILKLAVTDEYGIYHCTGEGECSWYDFAVEIMKDFGIDCKVKPCTTEEYPTPAKRPEYSSLRNLMLECTVGNEMRDWKEALLAYSKIISESEK